MENKTFLIPERVEALQLIRFIAVLAVSLFHFSVFHNIVTGNTVYSVDFFVQLFFFISGFVIMLSTENPQKKKDFLKRRIIRLIPLYWLLTLVTFFGARLVPEIVGYKPSVEELLKSMLLIPYFRGSLKSGEIIRPLVGVGHTLQTEMMFAVVFAFCMKISHKRRGIIAIAISMLFVILSKTVEFESAFMIFYLSSNIDSWLSFLSGIICYYILYFAESKRVIVRKAYIPVLGAGLILVGCFMQMYYKRLAELNFGMSIVLSAVFVAFGIFIVLYSFWKLPLPRMLVKLGDASFSYYLLHYYFVSVGERIFKVDSFSVMDIMIMILIIVVAWVCSYISWYLFENRLTKILVGKICRQ